MGYKTKNIQYIDSDRIFNKYELTPIIESADILDDYYRATLKNFEPDKPTFAYEEKRKNTGSVEKINSRIYGRMAPKEPFAPDLFLGDTTPDPRSISYEPDMSKYQQQMWRRKDDFKKSFKNDADYSVHEAGITEGQMVRNKISTYKGFKDRYKNFEESTDAWTPGIFMGSSKVSKVRNSELDKTTMDADIINLNDIENVKYRRDVVTKFSLQSLPKGWDSVPDHKIKIANYTHLLKSKNLNDIDIVKNKNRQIQDGKLTEHADIENQLASKLTLLIDNFKNKKHDYFQSGTNTKFSKSSESQVRSINDAKEYFKNQDLERIEQSHKTNQLSEEFNTKYSSNSLISDIRKNISEFYINQKNLSKGNNKESINNKNKETYSKKELMTDILRKSLYSNKKTYLSKGNNKSIFNNKLRDNKNDMSQSLFIYKNNIINTDKLNKTDNYQTMNYKTSALLDTFDNYNNVKTGIDSNIIEFNNEKELEQRNIGPQQNDNLSPDDFLTDTDFFESGATSKLAGSVGIMGSKYLSNQQEYETSPFNNNANDSSVSNKRTKVVL